MVLLIVPINVTEVSFLNFAQIRKKIFISIITGTAVFVALGMYSDLRKAAHSLSLFDYRYLPLILLLAPLNYFFRYIKWEYYLKLLKIKIKRKDSLGIFISGLSMTVTPGKVGEFLKSYLVKEIQGTPMSVTSPMIITERLTDGISMIILAGAGALEFRYGLGALAVAASGLIFFVVFVRFRPFAYWIISILKKLPVLRKFAGGIDSFYESSCRLLSIKSIIVSLVIGTVSWSFEGIIIYFVLLGFDTPIPVLSSVFIISFSSVVGAVSMLPGGLLVTEGSILGLLIIAGVSRQIAAVTTIITRFSTLWLGVIIGLWGLIFVQKRLSVKNKAG